jgi:hypothetical protein
LLTVYKHTSSWAWHSLLQGTSFFWQTNLTTWQLSQPANPSVLKIFATAHFKK